MLKLKIFNYQSAQLQEKVFTPQKASENQWIVGRTSNCNLVLSSPEVSRIHGKIDFYQGEYYYTDLGSTSGSKINNQILNINRKYPLKLDDLIHIGDYVLAVCELEKTLLLDSNIASESSTYWKEGDLTVKCIRITAESKDVKTFTFIPESPLLFAYDPGQFVNLEVEINGQKVQRAYSISSSPSRPETIEITVKRVGSAGPDLPPGLVSNWLHDHLEVGSQVKLLGGPMGKFTCASKPGRKLLLISAGSGITPMLSMTRWLYDRSEATDIVFFHSAPTPEDVICLSELQLMASRRPELHLAITTTRPAAQSAWLGLRGRFSREMLMCTISDWQSRDVYVCGPGAFMESVKDIFTNLDFPMENYHQESFGVGKKVSKPSPPSDSQPTQNSSKGDTSKKQIIFQESQKTVTCPGEDSILSVAQQEGINIRAGCLRGVCGACKKRKLAGSIQYQGDPDGLDAQEQEDGYILPCIAFPVGEEVVIEA